MTTQFSSKSLELVAPRLASRIEKGREQASALLERLTKDAITDELGFFGPKRAIDASPLQVGFDGDRVALRVGEGEWRGLHNHAAQQLGERLDIPGSFVRGQMHGEPWQRESIADLLSTHLGRTGKRDRFLIRSVGTQVRGVLSDAYRRLSSPMIAEAFQAGINGMGAIPFEAVLTDLNWHVRAILPQPIEIVSKAHGTEYVGVGLRIGNSDFGTGALDLNAEVLRLFCINGATGESILNVVHLGARLPADLRFSEATYRKDTEVQCAAIREALPQLVTPAYVEKALAPVNEAMATEVDARATIQGLVRASRITKTQAEEVERLVMNRDGSIVPQGPITRWTMAQAIAGLANNDETADGATELRRTAQRVVIGA